jgi:hypothetical protein
MAVNRLIYPLDYPATIVGPSELELRVIELEDKMESVSILSLQDRRDGGNDAIDLELRDTTIGVFHSAIPRFGFRDRNLGTKGFVLGGETSGSLTGRIAKFDYLFETPTLIGADIGIARHSGAGTSAVAAGYLSGGNTATNITAKIEKLSFDNESVSLLAQQLMVPLSELVGFATTADSFTFGGLDGVTNSIVGQVRSLKHASETVSLLAATLAVPKSNATVVGTTASGFIVGGKTTIGTTVYSQSIEKMTWITQSIAPSSLSLAPNGVAFSVGVGNDFSGYILGGRSGVVNTATISRIAHTTESISPISIALATPRSDATAVGSSRIGYLMAGGTDPNGEFRSLAAVSSISRLTFVGAENPVERLEPLSFNLPYAATGASGVSDYSPGTYSSNSISIVNLYDGIYSKLGHVHDERYPLQGDVYYRPDLRQKLNADLDLYVDLLNTVPSATGLGSSTNPFATITAAIEYAKKFDFNSHRLKIEVANGIYEEALVFDGVEWVGLKSQGKGASIILEGNISNASLTVLKVTPSTAGDCVRIENGLDVWVRGFKLISTRGNSGVYSSVALSARDAGTLVYSDINFGTGFLYHVICRSAGQAIIAGQSIVDGSCENHVRMIEGGVWSPRILDQRYSIFPNSTGSGIYPIVFAANLTMQSIFRAETGGIISLQYPHVVFTNSGIVTGKKAYVEDDGFIDTGKVGNLDSLLEWDYIPGSLPYDNRNNVVRVSGATGQIQGVRSFAQPISIPNGVLAQDGVNVQQLNNLDDQNLKLTGNQNVAGLKNFANNIRVPPGTNGLDAVNLNQLLATLVQSTQDRLIFPNGPTIHWGYRAGNGGQAGSASFNFNYTDPPVVVGVAYEANQTVMFAISDITISGYTWWGRKVNGDNISGNHFFVAFGF